MLSYILLAVYLLSRIGLWNIAILKDTIFWIGGSAFALFFSLHKLGKDEQFLKKILKGQIRVIAILIFLVHFYTLPFLAELVTLPIITVIILMGAYAATQKKNASVKKITDVLLSAWFIFLIVHSISQIWKSHQELLTVNNLLSFLLPMLLTLAFSPFLYLFAVYMEYEALLVRIDLIIGRKNKQLAKYTKTQIRKTFKLNLPRLVQFSKSCGPELVQASNEEDLDRLIARY